MEGKTLEFFFLSSSSTKGHIHADKVRERDRQAAPSWPAEATPTLEVIRKSLLLSAPDWEKFSIGPWGILAGRWVP